MGVQAQGCPPHPCFPPASAEDLSDSDEVFAKEMTKWSSNDFLDTLERPAELDEALGERWGERPKSSGGCPGRGLTPTWRPQLAHQGCVLAGDGASATKGDGEGLGTSSFPEVSVPSLGPCPPAVPPDLTALLPVGRHGREHGADVPDPRTLPHPPQWEHPGSGSGRAGLQASGCADTGGHL